MLLIFLISTEYYKNIQKVGESAKEMEKIVEETYDRLLAKNFDTEKVIEKDANGIETGKLIDKYTSTYREYLDDFKSLCKVFNTSDKATKQAAYDKVVAWRKVHSDTIDFTKLKYFKDIYLDMYPEHFTSSEEEMLVYEKELKRKLGKTYNSVIKSLKNKLEEFDIVKNHEDLNNTEWKDKNLKENSPWVFIDNMKNNDFGKIVYEYKGYKK